jgi:hypothetical protein
MTLIERAVISHAKKQARAERDAEWLAAIDNVSESMADTVNVGQAIKIRNFIIDLKARMTGEVKG